MYLIYFILFLFMLFQDLSENHCCERVFLEQILLLALKIIIIILLYIRNNKIPITQDKPLGPYLTNIFLSFHKNTWPENCPRSFKPIYYRRYVDECFLLFHSLKLINLFLSFFKRKACQHKIYHRNRNTQQDTFLSRYPNQTQQLIILYICLSKTNIYRTFYKLS